MQIFDNVRSIVKDDLEQTIAKGSRLSIAAATFSIYAYQELRKQLEGIDELRFIFTSQTFTTEQARKERREFYIPRLSRERSLYGSEFEIKLRNELSQKAIVFFLSGTLEVVSYRHVPSLSGIIRRPYRPSPS